jgi:iduronate 2-sulfatase
MSTRFAVLLVAIVSIVTHFDARVLAAEKLNVLFLMSDDLRPELGCYGTPLVKTPNIDGLAKAGVRFERAYVQYPLCNPSRSSMLTGRFPTVTGVLDNRTWFGAMHPDFVSLPKFFKQQGYAALRSGKIFHGGIDDVDAWTEGGEPRNFEGANSKKGPAPNYQQTSDRAVVLPGNGESHGDHKAADRAIEYLRRHQDRPFFLACGFTKPHSPPTAPQRFFDMYDTKQIPLPPDFAPRPTVPPGFPKSSVPARNGDLFINRDADPDAAQEMIRAYWASLTFTDWNVGRVLAELDRLDLRRKTVIVFWGDHGYHLGEKGKWSKHGSLYEIGTRVPLVIVAPESSGASNGKSCPRVVQSIDIYPTLAQLCGLTPPQGLQGSSLVPLLKNPDMPWDRPAFSVIGNAGKASGYAVRTERFRYAEYEGQESGAMLFDHNNDPHEQRNLAESPEFAQDRAKLSELIKSTLRQ